MLKDELLLFSMLFINFTKNNTNTLLAISLKNVRSYNASDR